jgi:hypothetical protein
VETKNNQRDTTQNKNLYKFMGLINCIIVLIIILGIIITINGISRINRSLGMIQQQVEEGKSDIITLKEDAFSVIDDTEIILDNGLDELEIEQVLNNHKYGEKAVEDGNLADSKKNSIKFNGIWGIEGGFEDNLIPSSDFISRLAHTHRQHIYRMKINFFNQREIPEIGNVICVPSSATFLIEALGYDIQVMDIVNHFAESEEIKAFARKSFGGWIEYYIQKNKLYQITGTFTYGLNHFMETYNPDFPYKLDYDYWTLEEIAEYVDKFGLMSATYFPSWVLREEREGGHMIIITKVYRDFEGHIIAFGINDPFGNPNVSYRGMRGWDGKNIIIGIDDMITVMKSYRDDHGRGARYLYRVLYFRDKRRNLMGNTIKHITRSSDDIG